MRDRWLWTFVALAVLTFVVLALLGDSGGAAASALSRDPTGWFAARRYLEERGAHVVLRDLPFHASEPQGGGVLVLTLPMQKLWEDGEAAALDRHLHAGGTLLVTYPLEADTLQRTEVLDALDLSLRKKPEPPLALLAWWGYRTETWRLVPGDGWDDVRDAPPVTVPAVRRPPSVPAAARVLYRAPDEEGGEEGVPIVFTFERQRGRVVVAPSALLANAWLGGDGNLDFLETLHAWLGPHWTFDEYHHGFVDAAYLAENKRSAFAWDLFMIHLALLYAAAVLARVRRFGPTWREPPVRAGSTAAFLRNLGTLHRELGHGADAARLLVERTRALDPSFDGVEADDNEPISGPGLVAFARRVAAARKRRLHG